MYFDCLAPTSVMSTLDGTTKFPDIVILYLLFNIPPSDEDADISLCIPYLGKAPDSASPPILIDEPSYGVNVIIIRYIQTY